MAIIGILQLTGSQSNDPLVNCCAQKSTYKLFGAYWDGMKAVKYDALQKDSHPTQPSELISFQTLLSVQDQADFDHIIAPYEMNDEITIQVDYWTETSNPVLHAFLEKRLGQMVAHMSEKYPTVRCVRALKSPSGATNA